MMPKNRLKRKEKKSAGLPHLGRILLPNTVFTAVPQAPPPHNSAPNLTPVFTALINAGLIGQLVGSPTPKSIPVITKHQRKTSSGGISDLDYEQIERGQYYRPDVDNIIYSTLKNGSDNKVRARMPTPPSEENSNEPLIQKKDLPNEPLYTKSQKQISPKSIDNSINELGSQNSLEFYDDTEIVLYHHPQALKYMKIIDNRNSDFHDNFENEEILGHTWTKQMELIKNLENQVQVLQLEKYKLIEINKKIIMEKASLHRLAANIHHDDVPGAKMIILKKQIQDLTSENNFFKNTIFRLNVELNRYQAQLRMSELSVDEEDVAILSKGPDFSWMVQMQSMAPLFEAYDKRLAEKDQLLQSYKQELNSFQTRLEDVIKENEDLHEELQKLTDQKEIDPVKWANLQDQAGLVLEESQVLMHQLDLQHDKSKDMHEAHVLEVNKLSKQLLTVEAEKSALQNELTELSLQSNILEQKYELFKIDNQNKMPVKEHAQALKECKKMLNELKEKYRQDINQTINKLQFMQEEKKKMALQMTDILSQNKLLEADIKNLNKLCRKCRHKIQVLQLELKKSNKTEECAKKHLKSLVSFAEHVLIEREFSHK